MIEITNMNALRVAHHLTSKPREYLNNALSYIKVEGGTGRLIATDGCALIIGRDAHDAEHDAYIKLGSKPPANTSSATVDQSIIRYSNGKMHAIEHMQGLDYPDVDKVAPEGEREQMRTPIDNIRAGDLAKAYLGRKYETSQAAFVPMKGGRIAELLGAFTKGDTVMLMGLNIADDPTVWPVK